MGKQSINLLITKEHEGLLEKRLQTVLPMAAAGLLALFVLSFVGLFIFINTNIERFNLLKNEAKLLEGTISGMKNAEGIYTLTATTVGVLEQLLRNNRVYAELFTDIEGLETPGAVITSAVIEKNGTVLVTAQCESAADMEGFIENLMVREQQKLIGKITSQGAVRDKKGSYSVTISFQPNPEVFKPKKI